MLESLQNLIGQSGIVEEVYGGYEITINEYEIFPWYKVCSILLEASFEVWITKTGTNLRIMSKPAVD